MGGGLSEQRKMMQTHVEMQYIELRRQAAKPVGSRGQVSRW